MFTRGKGCRPPAVLLIVSLALLLAAVPALAAEGEKPLTIEGKKFLPLRVLSRAFSTIYAEPKTASRVVKGNVPAFQSFFVYEKKASTSDLDPYSWYRVGTDNRGTVVGWMHSDDVFEWKQTMCLSYTHPEGRHPVLMFEKKEALARYTAMPADQRRVAVEKLYTDIGKGDIPADFPVVTVEPKMAVDISKQFYLLPILAFDSLEIDDREARILRLAAVTRDSATARESSDIRTNSDYLQAATAGTEEAAAGQIRDLAIDVVWVMDTTNSMQPYIDQTLKALEKSSQEIARNAGVGKALRFGIWAYRDSTEIPGIEYDVKNFTPTLQDVESFTATLQGVRASSVGSQGYAEDMFSGVKAAIDQTSWTPDALRIIILVGDAPAHEAGHKWNMSKMNAETLRQLADDQKITILALHIRDPKAKKYHERTEEQYRALGTNPGVGEAAYFATASDDLAGFDRITTRITGPIIALLAQARQAAPSGSGQAGASGKQQAAAGTAAATAAVNLDLLEEAPATPSAADTGATVEQQTRENLKAALVQWLGSRAGVQAPRDVVAWVTDKDLVDPEIQALEVRLLINKRQLDSLRTTLQTILTAGRTGQISGDDFFSSLQAAAASTARDPEMITRAKSLAQTGLIPEFLEGLPYTSRIMDMSNELWSSWSVDDQDMFLADLEARIMAYETIHDSPEGWVQLNRSDDPGDWVYPITLDLLP
ncbi:vWA domain-containing protein [Thermodesulfobacteriota bacterium B35]